MTTQPPQDLEPSFRGILWDTRDALLLISAAAAGHIRMIGRRPCDKEREGLIKSGNIFIYVEEDSTIKRWTDGCLWSPSRILLNFLVYRELDNNFPAGERKKAARHGTRRNGDIDYSSDTVRKLIGSLVDSYDFKEDGLVKKTFTAKNGHRTFHLVSYYSLRDALNHTLVSPRECNDILAIGINDHIRQLTKWRSPIDVYGNDVPKDQNRTPPTRSPTQSPSQDPIDEYDGDLSYIGSGYQHHPMLPMLPAVPMMHNYSTGPTNTNFGSFPAIQYPGGDQTYTASPPHYRTIPRDMQGQGHDYPPIRLDIANAGCRMPESTGSAGSDSPVTGAVNSPWPDPNRMGDYNSAIPRTSQWPYW